MWFVGTFISVFVRRGCLLMFLLFCVPDHIPLETFLLQTLNAVLAVANSAS